MAAGAKDRRRFLGRAGNAMLTVAATGGLVCIVLVPLAFVFHISLIMFKTGSMSPTIPAGSLAIVREIPAAQIHVGDVVTVDRPPGPPVTHRVVSISPAGSGLRTLTLRGDANPANDPQPYVVKKVRIVLYSVPKLAYAVRTAANPLVLGGVTVGAAALVTWAFWPRRDEEAKVRRPPPRHLRSRRPVAVGPVLVVVLAVVSVAALATPTAAHGAVTEEVINSRVLTLTSIADKAAMTNLAPATTVPWQIGVAARATELGTVFISLTAQGELAAGRDGLQVMVSMCRVRWAGGVCATGATVLLGPGPASTLIAGSVALASMPSDQQRWILVDASLPAYPVRPPAGSADLILTARGVGDRVVAGSDVGPVASTGSDLWRPLFAGLIAVMTGLGLTVTARLVRRRQWRRSVAPS